MAMTIQDVKAKVTARDLESKSVFVQTTLTPYPLRLVAIGRSFLSVLSGGCVKRIDPIIVKAVMM
jgi:hypothetical protein